VLARSGESNLFQITIIFLAQFLDFCLGMALVDTVSRRQVTLGGLDLVLLLDTAIGAVAFDLSTNSRRIALAALFIIFSFFNSLDFQSM
jgi:hypothetical protein